MRTGATQQDVRPVSELTLPGSPTSYSVQVAFVLERIDTALADYERWLAAGGR